MPLKPLNPAGEPFVITKTVDHAVTPLVTLDAGPFYGVETLILNPVSGVPYLPLVDYLFLQIHNPITVASQKEANCIIMILNKDIKTFVVQGLYSHGIEAVEIQYYKDLCASHKVVPPWMYWSGRLDVEHDKRRHHYIERSIKTRLTLADVALELNHIANQYQDGGSSVLPHIRNWQDYLFNIVSKRHDLFRDTILNLINEMKDITRRHYGDFLFTDNVKDSIKHYGLSHMRYEDVLLNDRGTKPVATFMAFPEGSKVLATKTELHQFVQNPQVLSASIVPDKTAYRRGEFINIRILVFDLQFPVHANRTLQILDMNLPEGSNMVAEYPIASFVGGTESTIRHYITLAGKPTKFKLRIPEYMWVDNVDVTINTSETQQPGYLSYSMYTPNSNHLGPGGIIGVDNKVLLDVRRIGLSLPAPVPLYIHIGGTIKDENISPNTPRLQPFTFPLNTETMQLVALEVIQSQSDENFYVTIDVSTSSNPNSQANKVASSIFYSKSIPVDPFVGWYWARDMAGQQRISNIKEGEEAYLIGTLAVSQSAYPYSPQIQIVSSGVGAAVEGYDFILDYTKNVVDQYRLAYHCKFPMNGALETKYKFLHIKSQNSNLTDLWIEDVTMETEMSGSWRASGAQSSPIRESVKETDSWWLHLTSNIMTDGTKVNILVESPSIYGNALKHTAEVVFFAGVAMAQFEIDAPLQANGDQLLRVTVYGPGGSYPITPLIIEDTNKPYYELKYIVNGFETITAYEGDAIECWVRCLGTPAASKKGTLTLSGTADYSTGPTSDFKFPPGSGAIIKSWSVNADDWTKVTIDGLSITDTLRSAHVTLTMGVRFPETPVTESGHYRTQTLNIRKRGT